MDPLDTSKDPQKKLSGDLAHATITGHTEKTIEFYKIR